MKISELLDEQIQTQGQKVHRISPREVVIKDPESGIETKIPKKPNEPGTIQRDKQGKLVLDPETPGDVVDDIELGDEITTKPSSTKLPQGTQGTVGSIS